jgi:pilus assembly protein CpaE
VLGFVGAKGGVGTTTLVLNIAAALARANRKVTVAEFIPGAGSCSVLTRRDPARHLGSLLDMDSASMGRQELEAHLVQVPFGFRVLFAPPRISEAENIGPARVEALLSSLSALAEFTLLDLSHCSNGLFRPAVCFCEFVLVVLEPEPLAMAGAKSLLCLLNSYEVTAGNLGAVIVNRAALSGGMMLPEIRSELGCGIVGTVPPAADLYASAHRAGTLPMLMQPECKAASAISGIASRLAERPVSTLHN